MIKKVTFRYLKVAKTQLTPKQVALDWATATVPSDCTSVYSGLLLHLKHLTLAEIQLLFYLVQIMDEKNIVRNSTELKKNFNRTTKSSYSDTTINRGFKKLTELKILITLPRRKRGMYRVNPKHFFKGSATKRIRELRYDFEQKAIPHNLQYRAATFDTDMARKAMIKKKKDAETDN